MFDEKKFRQEAQRLLDLVEAHERGEISEYTLLSEWKKFMRLGNQYITNLTKKLKDN